MPRASSCQHSPLTTRRPRAAAAHGFLSALPQGDEVFKHYVDQWLAIALKDGTYEGFAEPWVGDVELGLEG